MIVLVCADKNNGMSFHQRRQSMDRVVRADMLSIAAGRPIRMTPYSSKQFAESNARLLISAEPLQETGKGEFCFVEFPPLAPSLEQIEKLILYRWDKVYPADQRLDLDLKNSFRLISRADFSGYSHKKIEKEVYER